MSYLLPAVAVLAAVITAVADPSTPVEVTLLLVAAVASAATAFADQDKLALVGRRWSFEGEPKLSDDGRTASRIVWVVIGVLFAVMAAVVGLT